VTSSLLYLDTVDDRREIHSLLHRLPPADRVRFLRWACRACPARNDKKIPVPSTWSMQTTLEQAYRCDRGDLRLTNEIYADVMSLLNTWDLDAGVALAELVAWVKQPSARSHPGPRASAAPSSSPA